MGISVEGNVARVAFDRFDLETYQLFLRTKKLPESRVSYDWRADRYEVTTSARFAALLGADVAASESRRLEIASHLYDYQRWALELALDAKRFALWMDTGLGKTSVYLEWARQVFALTGGWARSRVLILAPLAVIPQVIEEARRFYGEGLPIQRLDSRDALIEWCQTGMGLAISNYEKLIAGEIPEMRALAGLVADESSMLKTGGGRIKWNLIHSAKGIEFKLSCTATPAPNEAMEYASQAAFLEKLRNEGEILWTFFTRDKSGDWRVKPHARDAFYRFLASWSLYMRDPARFGFEDVLASLPDPIVTEDRVTMTDEQRAAYYEVLIETGSGMFGDQRMGVQQRIALAEIARGFRYHGQGASRTVERVRSYKPGRVANWAMQRCREGDRVLIWTSFDEEGEIIADCLRFLGIETGLLTGSMSQEARLGMLRRFRDGGIAALVSKPALIGYGLNLQFVRSMVFSGIDDSFERMYQAIRRAYRLGQTEPVRVFVPYVPELEGLVFDNVKQKERRFLEEVAAQEAEYRRVLLG